MADDERESPSIAPPSMPWRRRREEPDAADVPAQAEAAESPEAPEPTRPLPTAPRASEPVDVPPWDDVLDAPAVEQTSPEAAAWGDPTPREEYDRFYDAPAPTPRPGRARRERPARPAKEPKPARAPKPSRAERRAAAAPPVVPPAAAAPPTPPAPVAASEPAPAPAAAPAPTQVPKAAKPPKAPKQPKTPKPAREPRRRVERPVDRAPAFEPRLASALVGAVIGGAMAALTYGALRGCGAIRGSETCGGAAGTLLLIAIVIVAVLLGRLVLDLLRIPEAGGTAVLGVALVCVISLLFLSGSLMSAWMALVIPLLSAICFLGAQVVSTAFEAE